MIFSIVRIFTLLFLIFFYNSLSAQKLREKEENPDDLWYKNSIIYTLDVDAFMDADSNGIGDFQGLIKKLDYLESLGIDAIWLAPFQPTPNLDDGYDVSDCYGVDPRCGTSGDFVEFMHQAKKRGIKIIVDLVVNHTSDQHPWFQEALKNPTSRYRDWYVWSKERPSDWNKGMVFPGVQKETWSLDSSSGEYFFHRFYKFQPDLNFQNPAVQEESKRILGYWLELGAAGFRLDAVPFIIEVSGTGSENPEHQFEIIKDMRQFASRRTMDAVILGEANVLPEENKEYFGENGDGMNMMFNFFVNQHLFYALATAELEPLKKALRETKEIPSTAQWAQFLRNHDEVDLGRLSKEQREKVYQKFGPEKHMQLYDRGIRRRLAPMLGDPKLLELANSLLFSLPGTPVLRYGEEIGMGDDLSLKERKSVRTPMQWSPSKNAGFSDADKTDYPVIDSGRYSYRSVNVEVQRRDPNSLLNWTVKMIRLRKECPEIGLGDWKILETGSPYVLAIQYFHKENSIITIHNFSDKPQKIRIKPESKGREKIYNLMVSSDILPDKTGLVTINLDKYDYEWYRIGGVLSK